MGIWEDFQRIDIRVGTILKAEVFPEARKPALKLWIDLGVLGIKTSSAQIVSHYHPDTLVEKQVVCVTNLPPKKIADFISQVLVVGFSDNQNEVILCIPDQPVPNGARLF